MQIMTAQYHPSLPKSGNLVASRQHRSLPYGPSRTDAAERRPVPDHFSGNTRRKQKGPKWEVSLVMSDIHLIPSPFGDAHPPDHYSHQVAAVIGQFNRFLKAHPKDYIGTLEFPGDSLDLSNSWASRDTIPGHAPDYKVKPVARETMRQIIQSHDPVMDALSESVRLSNLKAAYIIRGNHDPLLFAFKSLRKMLRKRLKLTRNNALHGKLKFKPHQHVLPVIAKTTRKNRVVLKHGEQFDLTNYSPNPKQFAVGEYMTLFMMAPFAHAVRDGLKRLGYSRQTIEQVDGHIEAIERVRPIEGIVDMIPAMLILYATHPDNAGKAKTIPQVIDDAMLEVMNRPHFAEALDTIYKTVKYKPPQMLALLIRYKSWLGVRRLQLYTQHDADLPQVVLKLMKHHGYDETIAGEVSEALRPEKDRRIVKFHKLDKQVKKAYRNHLANRDKSISIPEIIDTSRMILSVGLDKNTSIIKLPGWMHSRMSRFFHQGLKLGTESIRQLFAKAASMDTNQGQQAYLLEESKKTGYRSYIVGHTHRPEQMNINEDRHSVDYTNVGNSCNMPPSFKPGEIDFTQPLQRGHRVNYAIIATDLTADKPKPIISLWQIENGQHRCLSTVSGPVDIFKIVHPPE